MRLTRLIRTVSLLAGLVAPLAVYRSRPGLTRVCAQCHGTGAVNSNGGKASIDFGGNTYVPAGVQHQHFGGQFQIQPFLHPGDLLQQPLFRSAARHVRRLPRDCAAYVRRAYERRNAAGPDGVDHLPVRLDAAGDRRWTDAVYLAANAANGNGQDDSGDHIYTASFTLTPASSNAPTITGAVNGAGFANGIEAGSWAMIQRTNLSATTRAWTADEFANGTPTSLDGVSVSMGGCRRTSITSA
jgi:hypothetical protein